MKTLEKGLYKVNVVENVMVQVELVSRTSKTAVVVIGPGTKHERVKKVKINSFSGEETFSLGEGVEVYASDKVQES